MEIITDLGIKTNVLIKNSSKVLRGEYEAKTHPERRNSNVHQDWVGKEFYFSLYQAKVSLKLIRKNN